MARQNAVPGERIEPGSAVGRYTVLELVGRGGMGAVYRARDPNLGRDVALKLILSSEPPDARRLRAFETEARATAALTHPNLVTVYDVGVSSFGPFLVYEMLDGESLQDRVRRGDVTTRKAVEYGIQLAEGLAAAHAKGIVHKDLKASNVFVTREGRVKLLDFGLAEFRTPPAEALGDDPTASALSGAAFFGTPGYIAPEQILGQAADSRSDIFSLGVVIYEMLAGHRPFRGPSPAAILMAAVTDDPPPLASGRVPSALRAVVAHCLEKRPDERFQSARDVALALRAVTAGEPAPSRWPLLLTLAALLAAGALALDASRSPSRPAVVRPDPAFIPLMSTPDTSEIHPALSRDGTRLAFSWDREDGNFDIYVRPTEVHSPQRLTSAPELDCCPSFSPDGETIAFIRVLEDRGEIRTVRAGGGDERLLHRLHAWFGSSLDWSPDGAWLAFSDRVEAGGGPFALLKLELATSRTVVLTSPPPNVGGDAFGTFSPDGERLAFARTPAFGSFRWAELSTVSSTGGGERAVTRVEKLVGGLAWTPSGDDLVYSAARFDETPRLWRVPLAGGAPRMLGEDPPLATALGAEAIGVVSRSLRLSTSSAAHALAYARSTYDTNIWRVDLGDLRQAPVKVVASTRVDEAPQYSPDGRAIAFSSTRESRHSQIWVCDSGGSGCRQVTSMDEPCGTPRWSPAGDRLAFDCSVAGHSVVFVSEIETRLVRRLSQGTHTEAVPSWSRDGRFVYFASDRTGAWEIWKMGIAGGAPVQVTTRGGFAAFEAADGRRVFYTRDSMPGLFVLDPASGEGRQLSSIPKCWGYWSLGRDFAYVADAGREDQLTLSRVPLDGGDTEHLGTVPGTWACGESGLSLAPDGRSLVYVAAARGSDLMLMKNLR